MGGPNRATDPANRPKKRRGEPRQTGNHRRVVSYLVEANPPVAGSNSAMVRCRLVAA